MKQIPGLVNILLPVLLIVVLIGLLWPNLQLQTAQNACNANRTVQANGTAEIKVVPDRALIKFGVQSNAASVDEVKRANTTAIEKVFASLKAMKIAAQDISTDHYVINPVYENYDSLIIKGYRINNSVSVTLRDVNQSSELIASVLEAGANQIGNVTFYTSELRKYRDQAREMATKAAQEKADALAKSMGASATCVLHIVENSMPVYYSGWYGSNQNINTQNVLQNVDPSASNANSNLSDDGPVSLGQISVQATVEVTFGLK
jgi:uncharacterized protein YggE